LHLLWFCFLFGCWLRVEVLPRLDLRVSAQLSCAGVRVLGVCPVQLSRAGDRVLVVGFVQLSCADMHAFHLVQLSCAVSRALVVLGLEKLSSAPLVSSGMSW
jgi:hypothetical protein